jgi:hypothetical protein
MRTPLQENGYDCGLYTLAITHILADRYFGKHSLEAAMHTVLYSTNNGNNKSNGDGNGKHQRTSSGGIMNKLTSVFKNSSMDNNNSDSESKYSDSEVKSSSPSPMPQLPASPLQAQQRIELLHDSQIADQLSPTQCEVEGDEDDQVNANISTPLKSASDENIAVNYINDISETDRCGYLTPADTDMEHALSQEFITDFRRFVYLIARLRSKISSS